MKLVRTLAIFCPLAWASGPACAFELGNPSDAQLGAWLVDFGGYGVFEPTFEGSKHYILAYKPQIDIWRAGEPHWLSFPNDAFGYTLFQTENFHAGPAATLTLQSRFHGEDIDLRLGKADADLAGGAFAEYYPWDFVRTRIELLQGVTGNTGFATNLSADYVWRPTADWIFTIGPRAQFADDRYASDFFSTQFAEKTGNYVPFRAEGGLLSSGAEFTSTYRWTEQITARFYLDYNQLVGDAADNPRVTFRGSAEQFIAGIGASYKFSVLP